MTLRPRSGGASIVAALVAVAVVALPAACTADDPGPAVIEAGTVETTVLVEGLVRPTQLFIDGDRWLVAQLNGGEGDELGQVLSIDPEQPGETEVLIDGLDKPTGVARFDGDVWVMTADRLLRFDLKGRSGAPLVPDDAVVAAGPLPNNGRSEGTLSVVGGVLVFDTSGRVVDGEVVEDSGRLWSIDASGTIAELGSGFKHAYAHVGLVDGSLLVTEINDGRFDGEPGADSLLRLQPGTDHGWPACVAQLETIERRPVSEFGGTASVCADLPPLLATFDVGATPTGVALVPWDSSVVAVALWNRSEVVAVSLTTGTVTPLVELPRPQHLSTDGDHLLVVDHDEGRIYSLSG